MLHVFKTSSKFWIKHDKNRHGNAEVGHEDTMTRWHDSAAAIILQLYRI